MAPAVKNNACIDQIQNARSRRLPAPPAYCSSMECSMCSKVGRIVLKSGSGATNTK